jgi:hypothetical protein
MSLFVSRDYNDQTYSVPSGQPVSNMSRDVNAYEGSVPTSGYIGPNPESGLVWDRTQMTLTNEYVGIEKVTTFGVKGNIIQSESGVYSTYDANVGN